jgi:hypothetical protein
MCTASMPSKVLEIQLATFTLNATFYTTWLCKSSGGCLGLLATADEVRLCVIYRGLSGTGTSFLGVHRFPLPHSSNCSALVYIINIFGWNNRSNCGRRTKCTRYHLTPTHKLNFVNNMSVHNRVL